MVNFFNYIGDLLANLVGAIQSLIDLVISMVSSLIDFLLHIPGYINMLSTSINGLPNFIIGFATITIAISVVFIILGRKGDSGG